MSLDQILARVEKRLEAIGLSADKASAMAGKPDAIRNMRRAVADGKRSNPNIATLNALAPVLGTTATWLVAGAGKETSDSGGEPQQTMSEVREVTPRLKHAVPGGIVQAGSWRSVDEIDIDPDLPPEIVIADERYPEVDHIVFKAAGDSMNALKPRPIHAGDSVMGLSFEGLRNRSPIRDGMVVVVEQSTNGGHLIERSVKQIELYEDRIEFCPRSTNPRHKPIVVPRNAEADDGREVRVLAVITQITSKLPIS